MKNEFLAFACIVAFAVIFNFPSPLHAATTQNATTKTTSTTLSPEEIRLREIQAKLERSKKSLTETKQKEQNAFSRLVVTQKKLKKTQGELDLANFKIGVNQEKITKLSTEIKQTNSALEIKSLMFKNRLREIYKNSSVNYLELVFSSLSMSDFINRSYFFSKLIDKDSRLIKEIVNDFQAMKARKNGLQDATSQIKEIAQDIEVKKGEIKQQEKQVKEIYNDLKERRKQEERQVAELEKSSAELERVIVAKMAERSKKHLAVVGSSGALDWPLRGRMTSNYGYRRNPFWGGRHFHTGMDIAAPYGEVIRAADGGQVILAGWWDGYGKAIVIDHGKSVSTVYGHMSRLYMQVGDNVRKGQIIGLVGSTGYSTGPHLHFEVRINGKHQNPRRFLP